MLLMVTEHALLPGLTRVEELRSDNSAVAEDGAHRCDIVEVAGAKGGVHEGDRPQLHADESGTL